MDAAELRIGSLYSSPLKPKCLLARYRVALLKQDKGAEFTQARGYFTTDDGVQRRNILEVIWKNTFQAFPKSISQKKFFAHVSVNILGNSCANSLSHKDSLSKKKKN